MKLNLKVRFRNPVFWLTFGPAVIAFAYAMMGCFGVVAPIAEDTVTQAFVAIITALTTLGVLVDPTTKGLGDGALGGSYEYPQ